MNIAVLGAQWGDEGKGKIVDLLSPNYDIVARYQGGHNAGHTVWVDGKKFVLRLLPSGILHPSVVCVIGNGMVVDLAALFEEIDALAGMGVDVTGRLLVSNRAHLILAHHRDLDQYSEAQRGKSKIGTTNRGIGPAYEDKIARRGIRVCDLYVPNFMNSPTAEQIRRTVCASSMLTGAYTGAQKVLEQLLEHSQRLQPFVCDVSRYLYENMAAGREVMFEGAQGTLLDIDHGTYPYVTSSNPTTGGICTGLGVAPKALGLIVGVVKAYTTRVGEGPSVTELNDSTGEYLRRVGQEYGAVTGRARRCGWYDAVAARYAARINGLDTLAITKLDVLDGMEEILVCTDYELDGQEVDVLADANQLARCKPRYVKMPGWPQPTRGVQCFDKLPMAARDYVSMLEKVTGVPAGIISTGPDRNDTIFQNELLKPRRT